jgi:putative ABC transport system permease protein
VVAGVGVFILGEGFLGGLTENIIVSAIEGTVGHVMARPKGYPTMPGQHPVDDLLALPESARALLDQKTVAWTERTYFAPIAAMGSESLRAIAIGFDPARDEAVFPRTHWQIEGVVPESGYAVAVSHRVAGLLGLEIGSRLILQVRTHPGALNALEVDVAGIVRTGNTMLDAFGIFVPRPLARELIASDLPSHVSVELSDRRDAAGFAAQLTKVLPADIVTWEDETRELIAVQDIRRRALDLVMFILMALSAFGIANTILMAAYERVREIGTLRSMGMTESGVVRLFMLEGALIGVIGALIGALWGGGLVAHWARHPIDFSEAMAKTGEGFSLNAFVYTRFDPAVVAATILLGIVVAIVASIYPARVASRMSPADAVRA